MEDVNVGIQNKLTNNCPKPIAELAMKAIAFSVQDGSPSAVAERLKPLIRKLAQQANSGDKKQ